MVRIWDLGLTVFISSRNCIGFGLETLESLPSSFKSRCK